MTVTNSSPNKRVKPVRLFMIRLAKVAILVLAGLTYLAGQFIRGVWFAHTQFDYFCKPYFENGHCYAPYAENIGFPLIAAGQVLAIVAVVLLFANSKGLVRWVIASVIIIPLATLAVINFPVVSWLGFMGPSSPDYESASWLFGNIYIVITFFIVFGARYIEKTSETKTAKNHSRKE